MKVSAEHIFQALKEDFGFKGATGSLTFNLKDFGIVVKQNNVIGNILEEWLSGWLNEKGFENEHNKKQSAPDFWLNKDDKTKDLLEVKCFTGNPNFDIANFISYINELKTCAYRLHSKYLLIEYTMDGDGIVTINDFWLKNVWEICCSSSKRPLKVQEKKGIIYNIRPATWYSKKTDFVPFSCMEDFIAALEQTLYDYHETRSTLAENWCDSVKKNYAKYYGVELNIPRWYDIKSKYIS